MLFLLTSIASNEIYILLRYHLNTTCDSNIYITVASFVQICIKLDSILSLGMS